MSPTPTTVKSVAWAGEAVALIGANGAGKTTVTRVITGLKTADSGTLSFLGSRIDRLSAAAIVGHGIACVPEGRRIFQFMSVEDNLLLGAFAKKARPAMSRTLEEMFVLFPRLRERRGQMGGTLSGGEQQMLAIGRALMSLPKLLILDEPSQGLAPLIVTQVFDALSNIRSRGIAILLIEQEVKRALQFADRGYLIENGRVVLSATAEDLIGDRTIKTAYLGM